MIKGAMIKKIKTRAVEGVPKCQILELQPIKTAVL
jgi:hypothetical protein